MTPGKILKLETVENLQAEEKELVLNPIGDTYSSSMLSSSMASSSVVPRNSEESSASRSMDLLDSGMRFQFQALIQQLSQWEQFLFNHCK